MHSRRFIPMVDELSRRFAPSGGATSAVMSSATSDVSGSQVNSPMVTISNTDPYTCAIPVPVDWSYGVD
jgi:hypothetical protein